MIAIAHGAAFVILLFLRPEPAQPTEAAEHGGARPRRASSTTCARRSCSRCAPRGCCGRCSTRRCGCSWWSGPRRCCCRSSSASGSARIRACSASCSPSTALGGVLGSIFVSSRPLPRRYLTTMNLVWGVSTLPFIIVGFTDQYWLLLASLFIVGFGFSYGNVIWGTLLQRRVPRHMLGRDLEPGLLRLARAHAAVDGARRAAVGGAVAPGDLHRGGHPHRSCSASSRSSPRACRRMRSPIPWETETVPAHPAAVLGTRPTVSVGLVPALLVCLAAPAFFVLRIAVARVGCCWRPGCSSPGSCARRTDAEARAARRASVGARRRSLRRRHARPSLLRDLSLIALGLLIVSSIPLAAELDNLAFVRFALAPGRRGARAVPRVALRVPRPRDPLPLARRRALDGVPVDVAGRGARLRLADPAVLLHHLGRLP